MTTIDISALLHQEPSCHTMRFLREFIRLETKIEYGAITHEEYQEDFRDLCYMLESLSVSVADLAKLKVALTQLSWAAALSFTDTEPR